MNKPQFSAAHMRSDSAQRKLLGAALASLFAVGVTVGPTRSAAAYYGQDYFSVPY